MSHCDYCEYYDECELAGDINFCEECREYPECRVCVVSCKAGHDIECNNGFDPKGDYCSDEEEDDEIDELY